MKKSTIRIADKLLGRRTKDKLFGFAFNLAPERFEEFAFRYALAPNMMHGLSALKHRGFDPDLVVDVGAYHGDWSRMAKTIWPNADLLMVEANEEKRDGLEEVAKALNGRLELALLGAESGKQVEFHVMESGSSVMPENSPLARRREMRAMKTLNDIADAKGRSVFLKLDTQGYELEVLAGATKLIPAAAGVLIEVSLIEINEGAPLLADVVGFMAQRGFHAYEVLELHRRPLDQAMNQIDVLFVPEASPLFADRRHC